MWHASTDKKLVIQGKFKELFLEGVYAALDNWFLEGDCVLKDGEDISTNDFCSKPYVNFSNEEKLYAMYEITRCLTTKCASAELLQWNESSVYAVFEIIRNLVCYEIDMMDMNEEMIKNGEIEKFDTHQMRKLVSEAEREVRDYDDEEDYIDPKCDDTDEWESVILDNLAEIILWDDDFLECSEKIICDKSPERAEIIKYMGGIADNYYSEPMPLVTKNMLTKAKRFLKKTFKPQRTQDA